MSKKKEPKKKKIFFYDQISYHNLFKKKFLMFVSVHIDKAWK